MDNILSLAVFALLLTQLRKQTLGISLRYQNHLVKIRMRNQCQKEKGQTT